MRAPADRPAGRKTVHDAVHGSLDIEGVFLELLDSPEVQRLHGIHQLGLAHLVFPGANHTRLEHSLGVWHIGTMIAREAGITEGQDEISAACFLHDIGHAPYSHTLESVLHDATGADHMDMTRSIITGRHDIVGPGERPEGRPTIPEILENAGLDPREVARHVAGESGPRPERELERFTAPRPGRTPERTLPGQLLHGALDADQLDYLLRDAHYTGVAYGVIDIARLVRTVAFHRGRLVVHKSGLAAVESMLVARALMYSSVYFHRTVRICEMMLARAVERMDGMAGMGIPRMTDCELMHCLGSGAKYQRDIALRLKYRLLFKKAFALQAAGLDEDRAVELARLDDPGYRRSVEDEIARRAGVEEGYVIVDFPSKEVVLSEPRMHMTDVMILDDERGRLQPLSKFSPLARALQVRRVPDWAVMVSAEEKSRARVAEAARRILA